MPLKPKPAKVCTRHVWIAGASKDSHAGLKALHDASVTTARLVAFGTLLGIVQDYKEKDQTKWPSKVALRIAMAACNQRGVSVDSHLEQAILDVSFSHLVQALDFKTALDVHLNPHCKDDEKFSICSLEVIEKGAFQDERCHNMASMLI